MDLNMVSPTELAQSARLMATFVRAAPADFIRPYVAVLFRSVNSKITHPDSRIATAMLTVVGELAVSSGVSVASHLETVLPLLVQMAQRQLHTAATREVVYRTLGQICQGGGFVADPFVQYPTMLTTLLNDIRTDPDPAVREEVLRLFGIVGALDPELYNEKRQESTKAEAKADFSEVQFTSNKVSPDFYSRVAIVALKDILADASAPILQKTVVQALVTIFRSLGARKTIPYLADVMPLLMGLLRSSDTSIHDFVLQELGAFVNQTGLYMGPYVQEIFALLFPMWGTPTFPMAIALVQHIARTFGDEFARHMPQVFPRLFAVLKDPAASISHRLVVLGLLSDIKFCLVSYSHFLIPTLVQMLGTRGLERSAIHSLVTLYNYLEFGPFLPTVVRALLRLMEEHAELQSVCMDALSALCECMGVDFAPLVPLVDDWLRMLGLNAPEYHKVVAQCVTRTRTEMTSSGRVTAALLLSTPSAATSSQYATDASNTVLGPGSQLATGDEGDTVGGGEDDAHHDGNQSATASPSALGGGGGGGGAPDAAQALQVNLRTLSASWITDQVSTQQDWFEWLRRFVVSLLKESPSPAFRACLSVAEVHYDLARQLFNVAFASVWRELPPPMRGQMVAALEAALEAPSVPPEILQKLLDLVEYMEIEDGLLIDKIKLENLALGSAAYAKALRYAEDNYRANPEKNVERMIALYTQLRLPDAAAGVLAHARARFQIELNESFQERLERWERALSMYEDKLKVDPSQVNAILGRLRCLK